MPTSLGSRPGPPCAGSGTIEPCYRGERVEEEQAPDGEDPSERCARYARPGAAPRRRARSSSGAPTSATAAGWAGERRRSPGLSTPEVSSWGSEPKRMTERREIPAWRQHLPAHVHASEGDIPSWTTSPRRRRPRVRGGRLRTRGRARQGPEEHRCRREEASLPSASGPVVPPAAAVRSAPSAGIGNISIVSDVGDRPSMEARSRPSAASTTTTRCPSEERSSASAPTPSAAGSGVPIVTIASADPGADSSCARSRRSIMRIAGSGARRRLAIRRRRISRGLR